jgi:hypothetical protein
MCSSTRPADGGTSGAWWRGRATTFGNAHFPGFLQSQLKGPPAGQLTRGPAPPLVREDFPRRSAPAVKLTAHG